MWLPLAPLCLQVVPVVSRHHPQPTESEAVPRRLQEWPKPLHLDAVEVQVHRVMVRRASRRHAVRQYLAGQAERRRRHPTLGGKLTQELLGKHALRGWRNMRGITTAAHPGPLLPI